MTHEQIESAIGRLEAMEPCDYVGTTYVNVANVTRELMDGTVSGVEMRDMLIDLLEQADPVSHTELPKDRDGVPIHIGDEMDFCEGVRGLTVIGIGTSSANDSDMGVFVRDDDGYMWYNARFLHHHHAPTIESVLHMFLSESEDAIRSGYDDVPDEIYAEYVAKLREVMQDD